MHQPRPALKERLGIAAAMLLAVIVPAVPNGTLDTPMVEQTPIPDDVWAAMQDVSWHASFPNCPECACPPRDDLALLVIPYRDFAGSVKSGRMIVAKSVAYDVAAALQQVIDNTEFRFERIELVDAYGGDDDRSMAANNTSAFNCRATTGGTRLSEHAFGMAIDINPVQNPYVKDDLTLPPAGSLYDQPDERSAGGTGVIVPGNGVVEAFAAIGWQWGGDWESLKDYQHFSASGR